MTIDASLFQLFLIKYRQLPLGQLGTVVLREEPAFHEYTSQVIRPVSEVLDFSPKTDTALINRFEAFAAERGLDKTGVAHLLDNIKGQLKSKQEAFIAGVGTLRIEQSGYKVIGANISNDYLAPITASAVIHQGDVHDVKVGEQVHSSEEMKAMLSSKKSKDYWWVYALILLVVALAAILYSVYGDQLK